MSTPASTGAREGDVLNAILLLVAGVGIGWLVGLSVSPVVGIVVTGLVAAGAAVASILAGGEPTALARFPSRHAVWPLAVLIIGMSSIFISMPLIVRRVQTLARAEPRAYGRAELQQECSSLHR